MSEDLSIFKEFEPKEIDDRYTVRALQLDDYDKGIHTFAASSGVSHHLVLLLGICNVLAQLTSCEGDQCIYYLLLFHSYDSITKT